MYVTKVYKKGSNAAVLQECGTKKLHILEEPKKLSTAEKADLCVQTMSLLHVGQGTQLGSK